MTIGEVDLIRENGEIRRVLSSEASLILTGRSPEVAAEIMSYLNGYPYPCDAGCARISGIDKKPESRDERVVRFYADDGKFNLDCDWGSGLKCPSFGVKYMRKVGED